MKNPVLSVLSASSIKLHLQYDRVFIPGIATLSACLIECSSQDLKADQERRITSATVGHMQTVCDYLQLKELSLMMFRSYLYFGWHFQNISRHVPDNFPITSDYPSLISVPD